MLRSRVFRCCGPFCRRPRVPARTYNGHRRDQKDVNGRRVRVQWSQSAMRLNEKYLHFVKRPLALASRVDLMTANVAHRRSVLYLCEGHVSIVGGFGSQAAPTQLELINLSSLAQLNEVFGPERVEKVMVGSVGGGPAMEVSIERRTGRKIGRSEGRGRPDIWPVRPHRAWM